MPTMYNPVADDGQTVEVTDEQFDFWQTHGWRLVEETSLPPETTKPKAKRAAPRKTASRSRTSHRTEHE
jgi:hypothetical protein